MRLEAAFIGLCRHELGQPEPEIRFGLVNKRPLEEHAVKSLQAKFLSQGVRRNDPDTVIHVGVDASLNNVAGLQKAMGPLEDYTTLVLAFKDSVPAKQRILHAYSGQHRAAAMHTFKKRVLKPRQTASAKEVARLTNLVHAIETDIADEDPSDAQEVSGELLDTKADLEKEQELLDRIQGLIDEGNQWAIKLYDRSKSLLLSQN